MPQTINGTGTTYYGKKNLESDFGTCDFCGHQGEMLSYETGHYFVLLYVPVIPLGKKQILDFCSACDRYRVMPLEEWRKLKQHVIEQSTFQLAENVNDADAAVEHLQTLTAFHQIDEARELTGAIEGSHGESVDVQLLLGSWHDRHGSRKDADRCFGRAIQLDPNHPGCIRAHGMEQMEQGMVDEARKTLRPLEPPSPHYDASMFFMLAEAFQDNNDHVNAIEVFRLISNASPELGCEKWYRRSVQRSEKMLGNSTMNSILPRQSLFASMLRWFVSAVVLFLMMAIR